MDAPSKSLPLFLCSSHEIVINTLLQNQNGKVRTAKCVTITQPVFARNCEPTHLTPTVVERSFCIVLSPVYLDDVDNKFVLVVLLHCSS